MRLRQRLPAKRYLPVHACVVVASLTALIPQLEAAETAVSHWTSQIRALVSRQPPAAVVQSPEAARGGHSLAVPAARPAASFVAGGMPLLPPGLQRGESAAPRGPGFGPQHAPATAGASAACSMQLAGVHRRARHPQCVRLIRYWAGQASRLADAVQQLQDAAGPQECDDGTVEHGDVTLVLHVLHKAGTLAHFVGAGIAFVTRTYRFRKPLRP